MNRSDSDSGGGRTNDRLLRFLAAKRHHPLPSFLPSFLPDILALKHVSRILGHCNNPALELPEDDQFSDIRILRLRFLAHSDIRMYSNVDDSCIFGL